MSSETPIEIGGRQKKIFDKILVMKILVTRISSYSLVSWELNCYALCHSAAHISRTNANFHAQEWCYLYNWKATFQIEWIAVQLPDSKRYMEKHQGKLFTNGNKKLTDGNPFVSHGWKLSLTKQWKVSREVYRDAQSSQPQVEANLPSIVKIENWTN